MKLLFNRIYVNALILNNLLFHYAYFIIKIIIYKVLLKIKFME